MLQHVSEDLQDKKSSEDWLYNNVNVCSITKPHTEKWLR